MTFVTPFLNEAVKFANFKNLIKRQIDGSVDGITVAGTMRESLVLTQEGCIALVETAKAKTGRVNIFVGVDLCDTKKIVEKIKLPIAWELMDF
jgi:dihydrodipicolinate synthase/N-acetylneuraminate lyase